MTRFRHSGKLGDAVYSLPGVRLFPGAAFYVRVSEHLGEELIGQLLPLLRAQSYIGEAKVWTDERFDHDLDRFRDYHPMWTNLADCHLHALGLDFSLRDVPWLSVEPTRSPSKRVCFARSLAFRGVAGFWEEIYRLLGSEAFFVGTPKEHQEFIEHIGPIEYVPTTDLLELARVIAGAELFVGNQSCPYAIAEGLKRPSIQEVYPITPNCLFERLDAAYVWDLKDIEPAVFRLFQP